MGGGALAVILLVGAQAATSHEYWIEPEDFMVATGERVDARLFVGDMLKGTELPWLSHQVRSFEIATDGGVRDYRGTEGDLPALSYLGETPGLHVIAHQTNPLQVTFKSLAEFLEYLEYEGLAEIAAAHRRRGLPETDITEAYARAAKSLVQVGPPQASDVDRAMGLDYEIVAQANPYTGRKTLPVIVLWQGNPMPGVQLSIFQNDGAPKRSVVTTDNEGRAVVPLVAGSRYLLNSVHIEPVTGESHQWASTWASLSFATPRKDE